MDLTILLISVLVAGSTWLLVIGLASLQYIHSRDQTEKVKKSRFQAGEGMLRLKEALRILPMPDAIRRRWSSTKAGRKVLHAGIPWRAEDYAATRWLSLWVGISCGCVFSSLRGWDLVGSFLALMSILAGWFMPDVLMQRRIDLRQRAVEVSLPDFLDRMSLGLEAGLGFEMALRRTSEGFTGLLGHELRKLVRQLDLGHDRSSALDGLGERIPSHDLLAFTAAVKQADELGTALAKTLRVQTAFLRSQRKRRAREASQRLPVLIVFPLVFFFLPSLLIIYLAPPLLHLFLGR